MPDHSPRAAALDCPSCGAPVGPDEVRCGYCRSRLATVACPRCLALAPAGAEHCARCGAELARDEEGEAPLSCPACRATMTRVRVAELPLAECGTCDGLWLDASTFERLCLDREAQAALLHGRPAAASVPAGPVRYRPCPRCARLMNRVNFARSSGVVLDVCREHGTFFDRDELRRVVSFIREGGVDRAREREREALAAERRTHEMLSALDRATEELHHGRQSGLTSAEPLPDEVVRLVRALFG